jgi:hypothetical protein
MLLVIFRIYHDLLKGSNHTAMYENDLNWVLTGGSEGTKECAGPCRMIKAPATSRGLVVLKDRLELANRQKSMLSGRVDFPKWRYTS